MKTNKQNSKTELRDQSSNHHSEQTPIPPSTKDSQPSTSPQRSPLANISFKKRRANRLLSTDSVLQLLQREAPTFFNLAEVVGKWVWIQFKERQPRTVTAVLSELGFHWNNKRQVWQHPCGAFTTGTESDPREKYQSHFPADAKAA